MTVYAAYLVMCLWLYMQSGVYAQVLSKVFADMLCAVVSVESCVKRRVTVRSDANSGGVSAPKEMSELERFFKDVHCFYFYVLCQYMLS